MPVNIYDIARRAGVSVVTVSRVINDNPNVRAYNREKVLAAMLELDYKPNAAARSLANGRTGMIGLVLPGFGDAFMTQVMESIEAYLTTKGMFLVISAASHEFDKTIENNCIRLFREGRVDGMLILSPVKDSELILELKKKNIPFVLLDQHQSNLQFPSVTVDNFYGGYQATMSLIRGGAKRIAHISGPDLFESSKERKDGYLKALSDNGIDYNESLLLEGDFTVAGGYDAMKRWIGQDAIPDAVFAADDNTAFGILDAAREYDIPVPQKLSVIGYDDHPYTSLLHPCLSTVKQPAEKMARSGIDLLFSIIEGKTKRMTRITLKPAVILRDTTRTESQASNISRLD